MTLDAPKINKRICSFLWGPLKYPLTPEFPESRKWHWVGSFIQRILHVNRTKYIRQRRIHLGCPHRLPHVQNKQDIIFVNSIWRHVRCNPPMSFSRPPPLSITPLNARIRLPPRFFINVVVLSDNNAGGVSLILCLSLLFFCRVSPH